MRTVSLVVGVVAAGLLLTGCVSSPTPTPSPTAVATEQPTPTATPEAPKASSLVLSLDTLVVLDQNGAEFASASFAEPDALLALVAEVEGSMPEPIDNRKFGMFYEWTDATVVLNFGTASLTVFSATLGGLPIGTTEGIHVGSTRDDVLALPHYESTYDENGDGSVDYFGLQARQVSDFESLTYPGTPGTEYIQVRLTGDDVASLTAPGSDFRDI